MAWLSSVIVSHLTRGMEKLIGKIRSKAHWLAMQCTSGHNGFRPVWVRDPASQSPLLLTGELRSLPNTGRSGPTLIQGGLALNLIDAKLELKRSDNWLTSEITTEACRQSWVLARAINTRYCTYWVMHYWWSSFEAWDPFLLRLKRWSQVVGFSFVSIRERVRPTFMGGSAIHRRSAMEWVGQPRSSCSQKRPLTLVLHTFRRFFQS